MKLASSNRAQLVDRDVYTECELLLSDNPESGTLRRYVSNISWLLLRDSLIWPSVSRQRMNLLFYWGITCMISSLVLVEPFSWLWSSLHAWLPGRRSLLLPRAGRAS